MATASRGQDLLSSEFLTQLERLTLISRRAFRGRTHGERKSPRKGMSVEFSDYRQYGVGDDLRYVDWNIYGRLDRLYLKLFVDEEDLCLHLLLDGSGSMSFGEPSKLHYAARLAAAIGFVGLVNLERVGVAVVRDRMAEGWNPTRGRGQLLSLLDFAARLRAGGPTGLSEGLATYALRSREAGVAVLISDLLDPAGYEPGLSALVGRGFQVDAVQVFAPDELNPATYGDLRLVDAETGAVQEVTFGRYRLKAYQQTVRNYCQRLREFCTGRGINFFTASSDTPLEQLLLKQLREAEVWG